MEIIKHDFYDYGTLEWIEPEEFYNDSYSIYDRKIAEDDGLEYDILLWRGTELYCSNI